jgi:hypothetical protein
MVVSRDQTAGRSQNMKTDNRSLERVEEYKYLGTTLTKQNSIPEVKSRLKSGNACATIDAESFVFQFAIQKFKN